MNANTDLIPDIIHELIPITKLKISKEKWLETQIKYDENLFVLMATSKGVIKKTKLSDFSRF